MDAKLLNDLTTLSALLKSKKDMSLQMLIGVDGFVDEIVHVVDRRMDFENFTRIRTIEEFGNRIVKAAGLSTNVEFVTVHTKLGGNGPIMSNALLEYGVQVTYAGALGVPDIHPVFMPMAEKSKAVYSLCEPGHSDAVEFEDGKLIIGKTAVLNELTWNRFKEVVGGAEKIAALIKESHLFGAINWTMVPHLNGIWEGLIEEVFPLLPVLENKPFAFFDLCDPEKRTKEDILRAMELIGKFEQRFRTILGLNEKEVYEIALAFDIEAEHSATKEERLKHAIMEIYNRLNIYCLVAHPTKEAFACVEHQLYHTFGPYCQNPKLTTGAGDNFNAGFCFGQALGLDVQSSLVLGVATSGFYVRNAKSPSFDQLLAFLAQWAEDGSI